MAISPMKIFIIKFLGRSLKFHNRFYVDLKFFTPCLVSKKMTSVEARNHFLMPWANNSKNAIMFQKGGAGLRSAQANLQRGCGVSSLLDFIQNMFLKPVCQF
jgi:hypothetical protein